MSAISSGWPTSRKLPRVLLDRCLHPRLKLVFRAALFDCVTLADVYGKEAAQQIPDIQWIEDAAKNNCAVFTVNHRILFVDYEREAIETYGTKVFSLGGNQGNGSRESRAFVFGRHILSIRRRINKPGACFWRLYSGDRPVSYDIN